jgi:hypothetical protein
MHTKNLRCDSHNSQSLREMLDDAIRVLDEHWVHDVAQLFTGCALATSRIAKTVKRIRKDTTDPVLRTGELFDELLRLRSFMAQWDKLSNEHLVSGLACPDEIECGGNYSVEKRKSIFEKMESATFVSGSGLVVRDLRCPSIFLRQHDG